MDYKKVKLLILYVIDKLIQKRDEKEQIVF